MLPNHQQIEGCFSADNGAGYPAVGKSAADTQDGDWATRRQIQYRPAKQVNHPAFQGHQTENHPQFFSIFRNRFTSRWDDGTIRATLNGSLGFRIKEAEGIDLVTKNSTEAVLAPTGWEDVQDATT